MAVSFSKYIEELNTLFKRLDASDNLSVLIILHSKFKMLQAYWQQMHLRKFTLKGLKKVTLPPVKFLPELFRKLTMKQLSFCIFFIPAHAYC